MFKFITLSILLVALISLADLQPQVLWIVAGLALAIIGSFLHILRRLGKRSLFAITLLMFVCYSKYFWVQLSGGLSWWLPALLFASAVIVFFLMLPRLDSIVFPILMMGLVVVQLCWAATQLAISTPSLAGNLACAAAYLFAITALADVVLSNQTTSSIKFNLISGCHILASALLVASALSG